MLKRFAQFLWKTKASSTTTFVSNNCKWTTRKDTVQRIICGIPMWVVSQKDVACKFGEPYVAQL